MPFQDPNLHGSKVTGGIKSLTNGRTNERTNQKQYAPPFFFKVGDIEITTCITQS